MEKATIVRLDKATHQSLRILAVNLETSASELIREGVAHVLAKHGVKVEDTKTEQAQ
ncbi:hypothetical protein [Paraburkholderia dipogonis]|uniref:hypothetical protein n=1 Tax=Paraburkholderia dipogonis TaxID=1211383 RepID=UPI0038BD915E